MTYQPRNRRLCVPAVLAFTVDGVEWFVDDAEERNGRLDPHSWGREGSKVKVVRNGVGRYTLCDERGRFLKRVQAYRGEYKRRVQSFPSIIESAVAQYRENLWRGQERRVHVRVEKDAIIGVIDPVCKRWRVPYVACRGNTSQSEAYTAGKLFADEMARGLLPLVLYLGDHDPSGIDMTRDNIERLSMFAEQGVEVRRIALNRDQVDDLGLPGNFAKITDSRSGQRKDGSIVPGSYIDLHGNESWELDALKPRYIEQLIENHIRGAVDMDLWNDRKAEEEHNQSILNAVLNRWHEVEELFGNDDEEDN